MELVFAFRCGCGSRVCRRRRRVDWVAIETVYDLAERRTIGGDGAIGTKANTRAAYAAQMESEKSPKKEGINWMVHFYNYGI